MTHDYFALKDRLTTSWKSAGTKNFRLASSRLLGFYGTNLQNPSPSLMRCVIPEDGHIFLQPDQAGAEALIVAYEAPKGKFRRTFELGIKIHSYLALQIFTSQFKNEHPESRYKFVDPDVLVALPEYATLFNTIKESGKPYDLGKRVIHAKNYDMGPRTFQTNVLEMSEGEIVLTYKEAKDFLSVHEQTFPEIQALLAEIRGRLACRVLHNLFGYPRFFGGLWNDSLLRDAYAFIPQSTVGCITNKAYVAIWKKIRAEKLPWMLLNNKHDSLLLSVPDVAEHKEHARATVKKHIEVDLTSTRGETYQMKSGLSWGYNWAKYHKQHNPQGMREEK